MTGAFFVRVVFAIVFFTNLAWSASAGKTAGPAASLRIAAPSSWIRPIAVGAKVPPDTDNEGLAYLLVDQQENLEPRAGYYHEARCIVSEDGLQDGASISVTFDPTYQRLVFHKIRIIRQGATFNRLERSQIKLLQREEEMESALYDGAYTANCQLEDVRVGDVVEFAYTIEGANPILKDKYFETFATELSIPVSHAVVRIVYPTARKLSFSTKNRAIQPKVTSVRNITEWLWEEHDLPARRIDPQIPRGYNPYGLVQVSEFADWQQVIDWALPLYQVESVPAVELDQQVARLQAIANPEERILTALRFVQGEIRYLGIESGVGSHQPTAPSEVLRRRFGDCKDKTLLLATLLRRAGLTAHPALVSSGLRKYIADRSPSPGVFNHVILNVECGQSTYWLDATRSPQRGSLRQIYTSDFGQALVIKPGNSGLTAFSPSPEALPKKTVVETYHIAKPDTDARLDVVTESRGVTAEAVRSHFRTTPRDKIGKEYLQYYARRHPRIQIAQTVEFEEMPGEDGCVVKEHYIVPEIWQLAEDKTHSAISLYPEDLAYEMGTPGSVQRNEPLALNYPVNITQEIRAEMFETWKMEDRQREVANAFFRHEEVAKGNGSLLVMRWSYQTLADQVPATDVPQYDAALRKVKDRLGFTLTWRPPGQAVASPQTSTPAATPVESQFNWPIALLLGVIVGTAIPWSVRYFHLSKLPSSLPPSLHHQALEGLGGWLILVAFGLIARPLVYLRANFAICPSIFRLETWQSLTVIGQPAYHPYWMPILLFELIYNSLAVVASLLLVVLFFKRRAAWPRCFAIFLACMVTGLVVDMYLGKQIPEAAENMAGAAQDLFKVTLSAIIWIPYCFVSKRVRATFRY